MNCENSPNDGKASFTCTFATTFWGETLRLRWRPLRPPTKRLCPVVGAIRTAPREASPKSSRLCARKEGFLSPLRRRPENNLALRTSSLIFPAARLPFCGKIGFSVSLRRKWTPVSPRGQNKIGWHPCRLFLIQFVPKSKCRSVNCRTNLRYVDRFVVYFFFVFLHACTSLYVKLCRPPKPEMQKANFILRKLRKNLLRFELDLSSALKIKTFGGVVMLSTKLLENKPWGLERTLGIPCSTHFF